MEKNKMISVINSISVPEGMEEEAIRIRDLYVEYFSKQKGFVSSSFFQTINMNNKFNYVNIVVWDSEASFREVVNRGFTNEDGLNEDNMKVLGKGFPEPIEVNPGQYIQIR